MGETFFEIIVHMIDNTVEGYLGFVIGPFLQTREKFYDCSELSIRLRKVLSDNNQIIPQWFNAKNISYARAMMVIPCVVFMAWRYALLSSLIVIIVDFGGLLRGLVSEHWAQIRRETENEMEKKEAAKVQTSSSEDDSFEFVVNSPPREIPSWSTHQRSCIYGSFADSLCDKIFLIPCWIYLFSTVSSCKFLRTLQFGVLWCLIITETTSASIRVRAFCTTTGMPAPTVEGFDFSKSAVKDVQVEKVKQAFEMLGTSLFILPYIRYVGLVLLGLAVPLAYESTRRSLKKRTMYAVADTDSFNHETLKHWGQVKTMGSELIVGIPGEKQADMVMNASSCFFVDKVIAEAPPRADVEFLDKFHIDFVVLHSKQERMVAEEVVANDRCFLLGDDGIARLLGPKIPSKLE